MLGKKSAGKLHWFLFINENYVGLHHYILLYVYTNLYI